MCDMVMCDIVMCDMSNMTICEMVEMSALFILDGIRKTADYKLISISYLVITSPEKLDPPQI